MNKLPKIRENLLVQDLSDEVLIYDRTTNKSYCLNSTAKTVFNACDGKKTFADLKLPEDIVYGYRVANVNLERIMLHQF